MNRKFRLYCVLLVALLGSFFFGNLFEVNYYASPDTTESLAYEAMPKEFIGKTEHAKDGSVINILKSNMSYEADVKMVPMGNDSALVSRVGDQTCLVEVQKVKLTSLSEGDMTTLVIGIIVRIITIALGVWMCIIIWRILRSVMRGEVFVSRVARQLETTGLLIVGIDLLTRAFLCYATHNWLEQIQMAHYNIEGNYGGDVHILIIGAVLLVVSQVILKGKELKDEQELTI